MSPRDARPRPRLGRNTVLYTCTVLLRIRGVCAGAKVGIEHRVSRAHGMHCRGRSAGLYLSGPREGDGSGCRAGPQRRHQSCWNVEVGGQRGGRCAQHRTRPCTPAPEHCAMYSRADRRKHHGELPMHTRACKHPVQQGCHRRPCEQAPRLRYRYVAGRGATCAHRPNNVKTASPAQRHPHRHALPAAAVHLNLARPTPAGAASPSAQMHTWERLLSAAMSPRRFTSRTACLGHVPSRLKRTRRDPARHRHIVPDLVCSALAVVHAA